MTFAEILLEQERSILEKMASKVPSWAGLGLEYPSTLCTEQCSGEKTALYKADVVLRLGKRVADLTGGLGVDSWAFSLEAEAVWYNEMNLELCEAVKRNFALMGVENVLFNSFEIGGQARHGSGPDWAEALREVGPEVIYLDPARRDSAGRKVFRVEDCRPDVLTLLPELFSIAEHVVVKLSPMADISVLRKAFGEYLREIHIVQSAGEVKELLCVLCADGVCSGSRVVVGDFTFSPEEESCAAASYASVMDEYLYEPIPALMKAGAFKLVCGRFGLRKLAPSTHLYTGPGAELGLFKKFRIVETFKFGAFKEAGARYPHADVSARNVPIKSDELRRRLGITPGPSGGFHIFGCDTLCSGRLLIVGQAEK